MKNFSQVCILLMALLPASLFAVQPATAKTLLVEVDWVPKANSEVFVAEGQRFSSLALLKIFLEKQAPGTTVIWDPGCVRMGDKPLLSTRKEILEFRAYLEKKGMKLVVTP